VSVIVSFVGVGGGRGGRGEKKGEGERVKKYLALNNAAKCG
jgi:hypothetical protein